MCRFMVYKGSPVLMADLITRPEHSIIKQSYDCRERKEASLLPARLNADGFGLGWYASPEAPEPCTFVSTLPAWNNRNLAKLCDNISSSLIFAHVRAASPNSIVSEANCHPFAYRHYLFMHNGHIASFPKIRRVILQGLQQHVFEAIQGSTDSEHAFALFLSALPDTTSRVSPETMLAALKSAVQSIVEAVEGAGGDRALVPQLCRVGWGHRGGLQGGPRPHAY
jgi:glutamine amidotransferase